MNGGKVLTFFLPFSVIDKQIKGRININILTYHTTDHRVKSQSMKLRDQNKGTDQDVLEHQMIKVKSTDQKPDQMLLD